MHNAPSKWKNAPVELIVIAAVIAAGVVLARGGQDDAPVAGVIPVEEKRSVETAGPVEEAGEVLGETSAPEEPARPVVTAETRPAAAPLPDGFPPDMVPPGATLVSASVQAYEYVIRWTTREEGVVAAKAYAKQLADAGWTITSSTDEPGSSVIVFEGTGGNAGGWVAFTGSTPDVMMTLTLLLP